MRSYVESGRKVKILTARPVSQYEAIKKWLKKQGLPELDITDAKDSRMDVLFDDKAVGVNENSGVTHVELIDEARELISYLKLNSVDVNILKKVNTWLQKSDLTIKKDIAL